MALNLDRQFRPGVCFAQLDFPQDGLLGCTVRIYKSALMFSIFTRRPKTLFDQPDIQEGIYNLAMKIAGNAYEDHKDMWDHVKAVEKRIEARFKKHVHPSLLKLYCAVAILHDLGELKREVILPGGAKKRVHVYMREQWMTLLRTARMPADFINTLDAMTHRPSESYLEYIQRLARDPLARTIKLYGDLPENRAGHRVLPPNPSQQLLDKKAYLYEMAEYYLEARRTGAIGDISVAQFVMESPDVPRHLKNKAILEKYSGSVAQVPEPVYAMPGLYSVRRLMDSMRSYSLSTAHRLSL